MKENLSIRTIDGYFLSVTCFTPSRFNRNIVLINSATGVKQNYYRDFAAYLSTEGFKVYTYDYRGIGGSRPAKMRHFLATMEDWGSLDYHSMVQYITLAHPDLQLVVIGHSLGGQLIGMSSLSAKADAIVTIGSQTPYWKNFEGNFTKLKLWFFWYTLIPLTTKLFGYFPGSLIRLFEDLPEGVARQWARWAKTKNFIFDEFPEKRKQYAALSQPGLMISFSDDELAPRAAVEDLMQIYSNVKWNHMHLRPEDVIQRKVGHFGFFRKLMHSTMWRETVNWINAVLEEKRKKAA
jgi:predicted alpha/beta hydrolase